MVPAGGRHSCAVRFSSVAVPKASEMRLAVRSSLVAKAMRTWQLSRMAWFWPVGLVDLVQRLGDQERPQAVTGHERQCALEEVEPSQCRKLIEHEQKLVLACDAVADPSSDSVRRRPIWFSSRPNQRLGAADVRGRDDQVERHRVRGRDKVGDAPVAA